MPASTDIPLTIVTSTNQVDGFVRVPGGGAGASGQANTTLSNGVNHNVDIPQDYLIVASGPTAAFSIAGFSGIAPPPGLPLVVQLLVTEPCTLIHDSGADAIPILTPSGSDFLLQPGAGMQYALTFDGNVGAFRLLSPGAPQVQILNVKDYGAQGDGVTDDTEAIQAALNALTSEYSPITGSYLGGGTIFFPAGTYILTETLTLQQNMPQILAGAGWYVTQLRWEAPVSGIVLAAPLGTIQQTNLVLRDFQILNAVTQPYGVSPSGNYWIAGTDYSALPVGTLRSPPGVSNRLLRLVTPGVAGSFLPFSGGHLYSSAIGPLSLTTIAAASDGVALPAASITVVAITMLASGTALIESTTGIQSVNYTGLTVGSGTLTLTGCTGGTGTIHTAYTATVPTPYPTLAGATTADLVQIVCEVGDTGLVGASPGTMDFRTSYDGGVSFTTGYQYAVTGGNALAHGLTVTFPAGYYIAPHFWCSPPLGTGFSNIVGDMIADGTCVWEVIDGTNGIALTGQSEVTINNVSSQGFVTALLLSTCIGVKMKNLDLGQINGLWSATDNEWLNAPGTTLEAAGANNQNYCDGLEVFCYGIGYADSGGIGRQISNVNFESSTSGLALGDNVSSVFAWVGSLTSSKFTNWTGEGAFYGLWLGAQLPFTGGIGGGVNSKLAFDNLALVSGQNGYGGPAVEFGQQLGGAAIATGSELVSFKDSLLNAGDYAYGMEGIGAVSGVSFDDCDVVGTTRSFDTTSSAHVFAFKYTANGNNIGLSLNCLPLSGSDINTSEGHAIRAITGADSWGVNDRTLVATGGPYAVTLPATSTSQRREVKLKAADASAVTYTITVNNTGTETIDLAAATYALSLKNGEVTLQCLGTVWYVTGSYNGTVI